MGLKVEGAKLGLKGGLLNGDRYISVHTADPGNNNADEFPHSGGSSYAYARIVAALAKWTIPNTGIAKNTAALNFPTPTGTMGDPTHCGISTHPANGDSGDKSLFTGALGADVAAPNIGAEFGWPADDFTIGCVGGTITPAGSVLCLKSGLLSGDRYLSLHTDDPGTNRANEVSGGSYAAQLIALSGWTIDGTTGIATLNKIITYGVQTSNLPDVMWVALCSSLTGGDVLWKVAFSNNPDDPGLGDTLRFAASAVTIGLTTDN